MIGLGSDKNTNIKDRTNQSSELNWTEHWWTKEPIEVSKSIHIDQIHLSYVKNNQILHSYFVRLIHDLSDISNIKKGRCAKCWFYQIYNIFAQKAISRNIPVLFWAGTSCKDAIFHIISIYMELNYSFWEIPTLKGFAGDIRLKSPGTDLDLSRTVGPLLQCIWWFTLLHTKVLLLRPSIWK